MSQPATRLPPLTVEEYLRLEEESSVRHECVAGVIYALAGATLIHNRIAGNIFRRLGNAAEGGPCRVYMETVKLRAGAGRDGDLRTTAAEPLLRRATLSRRGSHFAEHEIH